MDVSAILLAIVVILAATAVCVMLFVRFGFGAILGFIVAVLMAQDMWVVPAMALVPILAHTTNQGEAWSVEQVGVSMTLGGLKNSATKIERGN
jgi:Kef-type K+ transport system membrane component KefB